LVPQELRDRPQWIVWRYVPSGDGKPRKVPTDPGTGHNLTGYTDGNGWMRFADAAAAYDDNPALAGVGFVLHADDPIIGIDMDNCLDPDTGELADWGKGHIDDFATYTETSPSGTGVRMFVQGTAPTGHPNKVGDRELYTAGRFLTVTGNILTQSPESLPQRPEALRRYVRAMRPDASDGEAHSAAQQAPETISEGERDSTLTSLAGTMRRRGMDADEIAAALYAVNVNRCRPPLDSADVERIAHSVGRYDPADPMSSSASEGEGPPPFDLSVASVGALLDTEPPEREWIVRDRLPLDVVGLLAAAGGTGKSMAVLQLAVATCTGLGWLGMPIERTGSVLILSAEDDRDEIHRRLHTVVHHYRDAVDPFNGSGQWGAHADLIRQRLHVLDRVGEDNRLTAKIDRETIRTGFADRVIQTVAGLTGPVLIVLDPLSRFDGGEPNDNADGTRLIESAEHMRKATRATVLLPHHVSKASMGKDSGQEAVRGASGLVDGARWVGLLATMRPDAAKEYGVDEDDAGRFVHFTTPKANYSAPWAGCWLERLPGGVLAPRELKPIKQAKQHQRAQVEYAELVRRIADLIERKGPMPKRRIEDDYGGTTNVLKAGQRKVRDTITRALDEGDLVVQATEDRREVIGVPEANAA